MKTITLYQRTSLKVISVVIVTLMLHQLSGQDIALIENYIKSYTQKWPSLEDFISLFYTYPGKDCYLCTPTHTGSFQPLSAGLIAVPVLAQWLQIQYTII